MSQDVWIVDDDHAIRWVLERALQQAKITSRSFENGQQLLDALDFDAPNLIISDIRMPGLDGLTLLQRLQQQVENIPVIIMTAHSDIDSAVAS
jgi:two-component system nitrogen regulation response regulator GlnG